MPKSSGHPTAVPTNLRQFNDRTEVMKIQATAAGVITRRQLEGESTVPKKCESCRFYQWSKTSPADPHFFWYGRCTSPAVIEDLASINIHFDGEVKMESARGACDREGDGVFVYFEPKTPTAGAAVVPQPPPPALAAAGGAR